MEDGSSDEASRRACVEALCFFASEAMYGAIQWLWPSSNTKPPTYFEEAEFDMNLLAAAVYMNHAPLVERLIAKGYDPIKDSSVFKSPIKAAARQGNNNILEILLSSVVPGDQIYKKYHAVLGATRGGHLETLDLILRHGVQRSSPYKGIHHHAFTSGGRSEWLTGVGNTSARDGSSDKWPIPPFTRPRREQLWRQPTCRACQKGHTSIVKLLLEQGANPNPGVRDGNPLSQAASRGYLEIVRLLLDFGADVNEGSLPAVMHSVQVEDVAMFRLLRQRGALLETPETGGLALKKAAADGLESMVKLLLQEGVEVDEGSIGVAVENGHSELAHLLRTYAKRQDPVEGHQQHMSHSGKLQVSCTDI